MTTEENPFADTPVSFTVNLPQDAAAKILKRAELNEMEPEKWLEMRISYLFSSKVREEQRTGRYKNPGKNHETRSAETGRENTEKEHIEQQNTGQQSIEQQNAGKQNRQDAENPYLLNLIKAKIQTAIREQERAENRLFDIRHSVRITETKKHELEAEQQKIETDVKNLLDEIVDHPYDKTLLETLETITEKLNQVKYQYSLMTAQYEDALGCFLAQKSEVMKITTRLHLLESEYSTVLHKTLYADLKNAEVKNADAKNAEAKNMDAEEGEGKMK